MRIRHLCLSNLSIRTQPGGARLTMKPTIRFFAVVAVLLLGCGSACRAQQQPAAAAAQPLNASISDYGTSFIFSPPAICSKCLETELGFESQSDSLYLPAVVTAAPFTTKTDFTVLVNFADSEPARGHRVLQFGNRFDFVVRQQVYAKGNFIMIMAPRGTVFARGVNGGRAGAAAAPQYSKGYNLAIANFTWTGGVGISSANPRSDYMGAFDYYRTVQPKGTALFTGFQHEVTAGQQTVGVEGGVVLPFRNGQLELESAGLDLNSDPEMQFQARVIVNWGRVFAAR